MKVTVVGLGYVGSVAAAGLASADHEVLGVDIDEKRVEAMSRGVAPIYEPGLSDIIHRSIKSGNLRFATTSEADEQLGDVVIIATGTPMSESGAADLSQVYSAIDWAKGRMSDGDVVVMKSTVPPGTGVRLKDLLKNGTTISYVSNPEFLREGQAIDDWFNPDRIVVGGDDAAAVSKVSSLYENMTAPIVRTDITSAEMIKYAANAFLAAKISFINEIAALCDRVGGTIDDVTQGIALDPRIGPSFLRPGVGYGGSCFPKDVRALDHLAMANGHSFELLRSVIAVNSRQRLLPLNVMRERFGRLDGVKTGVMGLAFKPRTDDVRESPAIELIAMLVGEGAQVKAYDPMAKVNARRLLPSAVELVDSPSECADGAEAVVLMTEWPEIVNANWEDIMDRMSAPHLLFDGRNALNMDQMIKLGFDYVGVGRAMAKRSAIVNGTPRQQATVKG